ncbi:MAG: DUF2780 domain-containing protein [Proteobacteria bacterium]|nr:DUF2780 domain-containing protein [Pseudomonadota bacterium]MBU1687789.1 DUF2780 domain-containing protein [Pseudomonadota bacterium]
MRKNLIVFGLLALVGWVFLCGASLVYAVESDLTGQLTKELGVTDQQAEGGAGAIFKAASKNMSADDFSKVTEAMPWVKSLMNAAPKADSGSSPLGNVSSMLGKKGSSLSSQSDLVDTFSKLGLKSEMISKYLPIVLEYAQSKGGREIAQMLKDALK